MFMEPCKISMGYLWLHSIHNSYLFLRKEIESAYKFSFVLSFKIMDGHLPTLCVLRSYRINFIYKVY